MGAGQGVAEIFLMLQQILEMQTKINLVLSRAAIDMQSRSVWPGLVWPGLAHSWGVALHALRPVYGSDGGPLTHASIHTRTHTHTCGIRVRIFAATNLRMQKEIAIEFIEFDFKTK